MVEAKLKTLPTPHSLSDILAIKNTAKVPIWGPITRKSITLLYGATGVGKTFFMTGLSVAIAGKEKFCGRQAVGDHRIGILDGEMDIEDYSYRFRMIRPEDEMHIGCDSINVLTREDFGTGLVPNISIPSCQDMYSQLFAPFDVIIIDNLNTTSYPRNDRDGEISQFLRVLPWLLKLRDAGKAVILIHHTNKQGQQMGSILKEQIATNVIELEKVQHNMESLKFKILFHKHRHVSKREAKPMIVEVIPSPQGMVWLTEDSERNVEDTIIAKQKEGLRKKEIAEQLGLDLYDVMKVLENKRTNKNSEVSDYEF